MKFERKVFLCGIQLSKEVYFHRQIALSKTLESLELAKIHRLSLEVYAHFATADNLQIEKLSYGKYFHRVFQNFLPNPARGFANHLLMGEGEQQIGGQFAGAGPGFEHLR